MVLQKIVQCLSFINSRKAIAGSVIGHPLVFFTIQRN